jgi:hypothetical protein
LNICIAHRSTNLAGNRSKRDLVLLAPQTILQRSVGYVPAALTHVFIIGDGISRA